MGGAFSRSKSARTVALLSGARWTPNCVQRRKRCSRRSTGRAKREEHLGPVVAPNGSSGHKCYGRPFGDRRVNAYAASKLRIPRRPRERNHIANIRHAGRIKNRALKAQAEAGVRHGAVAAQVAVPPVIFLVQLHLVEAIVEHVQPFLALRTADDFADEGKLEKDERLAKLDSELERMLFDRENILLDLAKLYEERERIADATRAISANPDANQDGVQSLIDQMLAVNLRITTVEGQLRELEAKIQAKFVVYGLKIEQMTEFGKEIRRTAEMMTGITRASDDFLRELERHEIWNDDVYQSPLP